MKVAITVWEDRISPVFDVAQLLLVAEIDGDDVVESSYELFRFSTPTQARDMMSINKVRVLICGAISEEYSLVIQQSGAAIMPFISGKAVDVLKRFASGGGLGACAMPGCRQRVLDNNCRCRSDWED